MIKLIFLLVLMAAGWFAYGKLKEQATPEKIQQSEPVKYVNSLQNDVKKAEETAQKANERMQQGLGELQKGMKEAGKDAE